MENMSNEVSVILAVFLGLLFVLIGIKGFSEKGIPLTTKKSLVGKQGIVVGEICIIIGVLYFLSAFKVFPWQH